MNLPFLSFQGNNLKIKLYVQPKASKTEAFGVFNGRLKVRLMAPPVDGKANQAVIDFFSALFKVPKSNVSISSGETGRNKTLVIQNVDYSLVTQVFQNLGF